ncbi:MAG: transglutaminase family protein [Cyanobacteria bacterium P01_H01_bin.119]
MRFTLTHTTHYRYGHPVGLQPHTLRLRPRSDAAQKLCMFQQNITPVPDYQAEAVDLGGDTTTRIAFGSDQLRELQIKVHSQVETYRTNPFDYRSEPWAIEFPLDYPTLLAARLQPYWLSPLSAPVDSSVVSLAHQIQQETRHSVGYFLTALTQRIYESCAYETRETGQPYPAGLTWSQKKGSCRDFAVLFMAACRVVGLAARFVSGYQAGDRDQAERDLHAWAEVYIPGGGWRGFDPTLGLAVSDRHIALASGCHPLQAAPVSGTLKQGDIDTTMTTEIQLRYSDDPAA